MYRENTGLLLQIWGKEAFPRQINPRKYIFFESALKVLVESAKKTMENISGGNTWGKLRVQVFWGSLTG